MGKAKKLTVNVFGNEIEEKDNLMVGLMSRLERRFPEVNFEIVDPTENLEPAGDPWIILDVGIGIDEVVMIDDLRHLDRVGGQSVHDYDVYMELRLKEKLGQLPKIKIIIAPGEMNKEVAFKGIVRLLTRVI